MITILGLAAIGVALLVLPGMGLRSLARARSDGPLDELMLAIGVTVLVIAAIGGVLTGFAAFTPGRLTVPLAILGVIGVPRAARMTISAARPVTLLLLTLVTPWVWTATRPGNRPSKIYQWYYWDVGRDLSRVHGVPSFVTEYGTHVRWLPDYLVFNFASQAYHGVGLGSAAQQLAAWRVPVALLGIAALFAVLRCWLRPVPALAGAALGACTIWYSGTFNAYKPEAMGVVLGLVAIRVGVTGLRTDRPSRVALAGAIIGVNMGVHAIAAFALALLFAAAMLVELFDRRRALRIAITGLGCAALLAACITLSMGWALQGRALVSGDAQRPHLAANGSDPTLVYLERNVGHFGPVGQKTLTSELAEGIDNPWPGLDLLSIGGVLALATIGIGVVAASVIDDRRARKLLGSIAVFAVLEAAVAAYFAASYDTYIPRHTGLSRLFGYTPLGLALLGGLAVQGYGALVARVAPRLTRPRPQVVIAVLVACGAVAVGTWLTVDPYRGQRGIPADGQAALRYLDRHATSGQVLLSNAGTRGIVEFWTPVDDVLEARQPLIEQAVFLDRGIDLLDRAHAFFDGTGEARLADRLHVSWIVIADRATDLGAASTYGHPPANSTFRAFERVWHRDGITIYRRVKEFPGAPVLGAVRHRAAQTIGAVLLVLLAIGVCLLGIAWLTPKRRARRGGRFSGSAKQVG
jgi:hypothetical protein